MAAICVKTTSDCLSDGGVKVDTAQVTPQQSEAAFARAAEEATSDEERTLLAYTYLQEAASVANKLTTAEVSPPLVETEASAPSEETKKPSRAKKADAAEVRLLGERLDRLMQLVESWTPPSPPIAIGPLEESAPPEDCISRMDVLQILKESYVGLGIPDLSPEPEKPKHRVVFDMGRGGRMTCHYHWVNEEANALYLIYDTRFEFGFCFEPPALDQHATICVTHAGTGQSWNVHSFGFVHSFGVFNIIQLVLADRVVVDEPSTDVMHDYESV